MGSPSHSIAIKSFPKMEIVKRVTPILDLEQRISGFVMARAREALGCNELGVKAEEWAEILGVTDRLVRMWKSGLHPVHKRYILSIAIKTQEYCKRAMVRIQSLQTWAEQVVIMSTIDQYKGDS